MSEQRSINPPIANGRTWIMSALLAIAMGLAGWIGRWGFERLTRVEDKQTATAQSVGALETRVEVLEGGKRVRFDIRLDRELLEKSVRDEIDRQTGEKQ